MHEFRTTRRIEFADTDMAGIVHFARYAVFMETAEHEFLRALGTEVHFAHEGRSIGWPRVKIELEYGRPAHFADTLEIVLRVLRKGTKSMTYGFTFLRDGKPLSTGKVTSVCCALADDGSLEAVPIPRFLADRIEVAPAEPE
jgi:YbgC/YbaW family acyl-CoA thioester hydrolase